MKKILLAIFAIAFWATVPVFAQTMMESNRIGSDMMSGGEQQQQSKVAGQEYPRHMRARGMYDNYGMMGGDYNMMGGGYGMPLCSTDAGQGMMGSYGMMPMMGHNGMMPMMGGFGMMHNFGYDNYKEYATFAKETRDLRKQLHNLMFDYGEARWNPDTTIGELNKMADEMYKLRQEIQQKLPQ